jgi:hypothetical protein
MASTEINIENEQKRNEEIIKQKDCIATKMQ